MKKLHFSILLVLGLLAATQSYAQYIPDKGSKLLNAGIGVGGYGLGLGYSSGISLGASLEFGVTKNITVGGFVDYRRLSYSGLSGISGDGVSYFYIGARGSYHFNEIINIPNDKVDLYAGIGLGYLGVSGTYYAGSVGGIFLPVHLGGRYFFSESVGGFAELGSSVAPLKLGVTFKF
ncbi:hypothetical protein [Spirosoma validum]|uniref:Outer membrane protein beta-barrel domain-containing protein n=1 Tax=Spirosoma validum TaxID=2771355 RepID=A0A927GEN0_9BACT|nr:hypothetical protein [Spirosoma validum]MBD2754853.1 hypothetical protein [Spirosoma validum]